MHTHLFYRLYTFLQQSAFERPTPEFFKITDDFLISLYAIIENNLDTSSLSVGFLARNLAMSKSTLNRKLLLRTGLSPNEIIRRYRLQKAAILLLAGKNVSEAAYLCGFETPSYFTQCFKKFYKITPKKYAQAGMFNSMNNYVQAS
ncbi:MAG TPA: AraC family transcriptional regulator [Parafilimonas sp.]|nr:AraC family transcriptional regulator [Parafilimonas sp.]